jgi:hypothetical protein
MVVGFLTLECAGGGFLAAGNSSIFFPSRHQSACSLVVAFVAFFMSCQTYKLLAAKNNSIQKIS